MMPSQLLNNIPPTDFTKNCQGYYFFTANQIDLNILMRTSPLRQLFFSFCKKDRPKACGFRKDGQLFFFEKKSCKKRQKASPALAAFCAQGRTKSAGDIQRISANNENTNLFRIIKGSRGYGSDLSAKY